ncbi:MAG: cob(I)yrinic acid a,c-diamide adenosyltransferase [Longimicrobiales bacterium]|nr:cob(I)yrinic acid a,c-diamide adenosyltransferase [Longimicrobiales bacterium]
MKIYTRTGDAGETALFGGGRVSKDHDRVAAYGTVDELNALMGWAAACVRDDGIRGRLEALQHDLFALGANLAARPRDDGAHHPHLPPLPAGRVAEMEAWIDAADAELPALTRFILPGGSPGAAALHVARTVCRRAERAVVHLATLEPVEEEAVVYLNRLSDLLFALARLENHRAGTEDVVWERREPEGSW